MKSLVILIIGLFVFVSCTTPNPYSQWYTQYYDGILIPTENEPVKFNIEVFNPEIDT